MPVINQKLPEIYILLVQGDLNIKETQDLKNAFEEAFTAAFKNIWIDCSSLTFISVEAMRLILSYLNKIEADGINLVLYNVNEVVMKRLQVSGLDEYLNIVPTIKEAYVYCRNQKYLKN